MWRLQRQPTSADAICLPDSGRSAFLSHHDIRERIGGLKNRSYRKAEPAFGVGKLGKGRERPIVVSVADLIRFKFGSSKRLITSRLAWHEDGQTPSFASRNDLQIQMAG